MHVSADTAIDDAFPRGTGRLSAAYWWGIAGVGALLVNAVVQLGGRGLETMRAGLGPVEWLALLALTVAFVWGEGVRALGQRWVPGVVARAAELRPRSPRWHRILAPLYAMSLIGAGRRAAARAWLGVTLIVLAVLLVRALPEPWRGIVDVAVAAALLWGVIAMARQAVAAARRPEAEAQSP